MRSISRGLIVPAARTWLGTPYLHQHQKRGRAVDCVGLIIGVGTGIGALSIDPDAWEPFSRYGRTPNPAKMGEAMNRWLVPLERAPKDLPADGAIAWMGWREHLPMHLGVLATLEDGRRSLIHAYARVGKVVEHGLAGAWPDRVISWWDFPNLEG